MYYSVVGGRSSSSTRGTAGLDKQYKDDHLDQTFFTYLKYGLGGVVLYCILQIFRSFSQDTEVLASSLLTNGIINIVVSTLLLVLLFFGPKRPHLAHGYAFFIAGMLTATSLRTALLVGDPALFLPTLVVLLGASCMMLRAGWFAATFLMIGGTYLYTRLFLPQDEVSFAQNSIPLATMALSIALFASRRHLQTQALTAQWKVSQSEAALKEELDRRIATEKELMQARERLKVVMDQVPIGIFWKDEKGNYVGCNKIFLELQGFQSEEDILGKTIDEVYPNEGTLPSIHDLERFVIQDGVPVMNRVDHLYRIEGKLTYAGDLAETNQNSVYIERSRVPLHGTDGKVVGILGTMEDVTSAVLAKKQEAQMEQRMLNAQKFESLGSLSGGIAHEFNNILVGVMGNADFMRMKLEPESKLHKQVDAVIDSAQRASRLVQQMLLYSGRREIQREWLDLNPLIEDMQNMLGAMVSKNVTLEIVTASEGPSTVADGSQLRQVLVNLVMNAAEAIEEDDGSITVRTGTDSPDALPDSGSVPPVFLEVSDSGAGMDGETRHRIFDPFFSTKFMGRGLGMAAVQGIVHAHDGVVNVESSPGHGTTIRVILPGVGSEVSRSDLADASAPVLTQPSHRSGKVLPVDDEDIVVQVTSSMLRNMGYSVTVATDGQMGLQRFEEANHNWALLIVDRTMPKMSGEQLITEIRKQSIDVPIVICSGYSDSDLGETILRDSMTRTLNKPFQQHDLEACIQTLSV